VLALGLAAVAAATGAQEAPGELALVMVRTAGCPWCLAWDREVRAGYLASDVGARLGLMELDLREVDGQGMVLEGPVSVTPVFLLVRRAPAAGGLEGAEEVGRLVGYPGADFFWGYLDGWLAGPG
jgi:hypothetical protein